MELPPELVIEIAQNLTCKSIIFLAMVNRNLSKIMIDQWFWKTLLSRDFPWLWLDGNEDYKQAYKQIYIQLHKKIHKNNYYMGRDRDTGLPMSGGQRIRYCHIAGRYLVNLD